MKKTGALVSALTAISISGLQADISLPYSGATVSFSSFYQVTGGVFDTLPDTYYAVMYDDDMSSATHILVYDLSLDSSSDTVLGGNFDAVNASTAEVVAEGSIGFKFDSADDVDGSYPIVGVIPLANGFSNTGITSTSTGGELDGESGTIAYNPAIGVMRITIGSASSDVAYVNCDGSELYLESPFVISDDSASTMFYYGFVGMRADGSMTGTITGDLSSDNSIYKITVVDDANDSDSDGTCDLFDADNYWYSNSSSSYDGGDYASNWFGDFFFYYLPRWTYSMTGYDPADHAWIWHYNHGFLYGYNYVDDSGVKWAIFYDYNLGWWITSESLYPLVYAFNANIDGTSYGASWLYYIEDTGDTSSSRCFYGYNSSLQGSSNCGYNGWWMVKGAN